MFMFYKRNIKVIVMSIGSLKKIPIRYSKKMMGTMPLIINFKLLTSSTIMNNNTVYLQKGTNRNDFLQNQFVWLSKNKVNEATFVTI